MDLAGAAFHVFGALGRAFGRVLLWFVILLGVAGGGVEVISRVTTTGSVGIGTHIAAVIAGLVAGYAAALTVIVGEVVRVLIGVVQIVQKGLKGAETDAGSVLHDIEGVISGGAKKK
jgi:hypothetical protein